MDLSNKRYETIFVSTQDHYGGSDNHGLFQIFKYFKNTLKKDCAFICTQESFMDYEDLYDLSKLGGNLPLSKQINSILYNKNNPNSWQDFSTFSLESENTKNIDNLLNHFPKHKNIILGDKFDINEILLSKILKRFDSKLILIAMVNNAHTGLCSYPTEHMCDKYKFEQGCYNCPENRNRNAKDINQQT